MVAWRSLRPDVAFEVHTDLFADVKAQADSIWIHRLTALQPGKGLEKLGSLRKSEPWSLIFYRNVEEVFL